MNGAVSTDAASATSSGPVTATDLSLMSQSRENTATRAPIGQNGNGRISPPRPSSRMAMDSRRLSRASCQAFASISFRPAPCGPPFPVSRPSGPVRPVLAGPPRRGFAPHGGAFEGPAPFGAAPGESALRSPPPLGTLPRGLPLRSPALRGLVLRRTGRRWPAPGDPVAGASGPSGGATGPVPGSSGDADGVPEG